MQPWLWAPGFRGAFLPCGPAHAPTAGVAPTASASQRRIRAHSETSANCWRHSPAQQLKKTPTIWQGNKDRNKAWASVSTNRRACFVVLTRPRFTRGKRKKEQKANGWLLVSACIAQNLLRTPLRRYLAWWAPWSLSPSCCTSSSSNDAFF